MRDVLVVVSTAEIGVLAHFVQCPKYIQVENASPIAAVEAFDEAVPHRLARLDEAQFHIVSFSRFRNAIETSSGP